MAELFQLSTAERLDALNAASNIPGLLNLVWLAAQGFDGKQLAYWGDLDT